MRNRCFAIVCLLIGLTSSAALAQVRVGGRVLGPDGAPLAKAAVRLLPMEPHLEQLATIVAEGPAEAAAETLSDGDGGFVLDAPGAGLWQVRIDAEGMTPVVFALQPLIEPLELPDARLDGDAGLRVRVVDASGEPLAGATVLVRQERGRFVGLQNASWTVPARGGSTDDQGSITLPHRTGRRFNVSAHAPGHAVVERRGLLGTAARLRLPAGHDATLEVRGSSGEPVPRVRVGAGKRPHPIGRTDAAGRLPMRFDGATEQLSLFSEDGRRLDVRIERPVEGARPVAVELPDRSIIAGRLIDAETRRSIEGGVIWDRSDPAGAATSDGAGGFAIGGPAGQRLRVVAGAPGYLPSREREFQLLDDGRPGPTLALRPGAAIEGTVVDADGNAVSGADLGVAVKQTPGMMRIEFGGPSGLPQTRSGNRGHFRLSPLDPEKRYTVTASADGYAPAEEEVAELKPYETKGGLRLLLDAGGTVTGVVVDGDGAPLAGAAVTLEKGETRGSGMMRVLDGAPGPPREAVGDDDGRFVFSGIPAGRFDVAAKLPGFARGAVAGVEVAEAGEGVDVGEIRLEPGERLQGLVTDRDGAPVEGVRVSVREAGSPSMTLMMGPPSEPKEPDAVTDPTGWFAVDDLAPGGKYSTSFERTGYVGSNHAAVQLPHPEPIRITLDPSSRVEGLVLDSEGEPIGGAQVSLARTRTMEMGGSQMMMMMQEDDDTDHEGRFVFEDQEPGRVSLSAVAAGFQEAKLDNVEIPEGEDVTDVEIPLPSGAIVHGRLMTPDGRPAIGATVNKVEPEERMARFGGEPVDGSGYYRLEGLPTGEASIEANHPDYPRLVRDVDLSEGFNNLDMELEGGHEVTGTITDSGGNVVANAAVRLNPAGSFWGGPEALSKGDGSYSMPGVQDGDYTLSIRADGYAAADRARDVKVEGGPLAGIDAQLTAGATIVGRVLGLAPEEMARVSVRLDRNVFFDTGERPDAQGNFRIENVKPGSYQVVASVDRGRQARADVKVEEGAVEVRQDVEFAGGLTVTGSALQGDTPVTGASIYISGVDIDREGFAETDHQGGFELEGLEAGSYQLRLQQFRTGLVYDSEFDLSASRELTLRIPTARVAGRVLDAADRRPVAGVQIRLSTVGDEPSHRSGHGGTTDLDGKFEVANVPDGNWTLTADKAGFAAHTQSLSVQLERGVENLRIELDPTEGLILETRLPGGAAPDQVRAAVLDPAGNALVSGSFATGENGKVRLASVPRGRWELLLSAAGSGIVRLEADAPGPPVPVVLPPACSLRLTVPELAEEGAAATARIVGADGIAFRALGWSGRPTDEFRLERGSTFLGQMPPGSWTVSVSTPDGRGWQGSVTTRAEATAELTLE